MLCTILQVAKIDNERKQRSEMSAEEKRKIHQRELAEAVSVLYR